MNMARRLCILFLIVIFTLSAAGAAFSLENLFLTGVITNINYRAKQVQIDLRNKGCRGLRTFTFYDFSKFKKTVGNKIEFYIDSENCPGPSEVRVITAVREAK